MASCRQHINRSTIYTMTQENKQEATLVLWFGYVFFHADLA